jgi:beta-fructofuranosidase
VTETSQLPDSPIADRFRPRYHFTAPKNWLNDPNGLIQWRGIYHLFYQYHPFSALSGIKYWGHAISRDLAHWEHLPIALEPDPEGPDASGCWSGAAFDANGVATILYTGVRDPDFEPQRPCFATSNDDLLRTWTKHPGNPVITEPPADLDIVFFRDHTVWREDGAWYQGIGSGIVGEGGTVLVYRSSDLENWEYLHPLLVGDARQTVPFSTGTGWECPDFFTVDGQHGLIFASHDHGGLNVAWITGEYRNQRLSPTRTGLVDGGPSFYAPQSFTDKAGRRIMIGWLRERRSDDEQVSAGWSGAMTLPRVLHIAPDGGLITAPAPEAMAFRSTHVHIRPEATATSKDDIVGGVRGMALEIEATFDTPVTPVGMTVACATDRSEETIVLFDPVARMLSLDTTGSSTDPEVKGMLSVAQVEFAIDGPITIRVFLDHSIIEVFLNDRICISDRIYPASPESDEVSIRGARHLQSLDVWTMG